MAIPVQTIGLKYTVDNGATWLPSTGDNEFQALRVHSFLRAEEGESSDELMDASNICPSVKARLIVTIELDTKQFNPAGNNTGANGNFKYIHKLRARGRSNMRFRRPMFPKSTMELLRTALRK